MEIDNLWGKCIIAVREWATSPAPEGEPRILINTMHYWWKLAPPIAGIAITGICLWAGLSSDESIGSAIGFAMFTGLFTFLLILFLGRRWMKRILPLYVTQVSRFAELEPYNHTEVTQYDNRLTAIYRCPHCRQRGISVTQKLFLGTVIPKHCQRCGRKVVSPNWGAIVVVPFVIAIFAGLFAGSIILYILIVAASILVGLVTSLLFVPVVKGE